MVAAVQLFHALAGDVRVDLSRRHVAVAEQQLYDAQISAVVEQMGRERVPDGVRRELLFHAGFLRVALDDVPERLTRHAIATPRREQVFGLPLEQDFDARPFDELLDPVLRLVAERDQPLAVAFADDSQHALIQVDLRHLQIDELRHSNASRVEHLEHRAVAVAKRLVDDRSSQQSLDLFFRERLRQRAADLRHRDLRGRILAQYALAEQITIEAAETRELARGRTRLRARFDAPRDVIEDVGSRGARELDVARREALVQSDEVGAVGTERVLRQPALQPDRIEKAIDQRFWIAGHTLARLWRAAMQEVMRHSETGFVSDVTKLDKIQSVVNSDSDARLMPKASRVCGTGYAGY